MARTPAGIERRREADRIRQSARYRADPEAGSAKKRAQLAAQTPEQKERRLEAVRKWRAAHPDKVREYNRVKRESGYFKAWRDREKAKDPAAWRRSQMAIRIKSKYGITIDQYDAMLEAQGGVCAICRRPERTTIKGTLCMLAVDHDHGSSAVRGLLCTNCNMLIGGAHHDADILRAAIAYLST